MTNKFKVINADCTGIMFSPCDELKAIISFLEDVSPDIATILKEAEARRYDLDLEIMISDEFDRFHDAIFNCVFSYYHFHGAKINFDGEEIPFTPFVITYYE